jgi:hypothetical protein
MAGTNGKTETIAIPQPKRLGVGQTPDGLIEIEIQLRKFRLWVSETNVFTRFNLSSLVTELLKEMDGVASGYESQVRRNMLTEVWAPLSVCSRGDVPTREQFLSLPTVDMALWVDTAKELGHSFEWLDGLNQIYTSAAEQTQAEKDDVKKKSRVRSNHRRTHEVPAE